MSLREWLFAIGALLIIGIVIDGIRRIHRARKDSIAISSGMGADELKESPLDEDYNPELPNGGARTISRETLEERGYVKRERSNRFGSPKPKPTRPVVGKTEPEEDRGESESEADWDNGVAGQDASLEQPDTGWGATDDEPVADDEILGEPRVVTPQPVPKPEPKTSDEEELPTVTEVEEDTARREPAKPKEGRPLAGANRPEAREVVVINVLARDNAEFKGPDLQKLFEACGLEYGDMDIYHRHESADTTSPVQFSVASAVEPGTFKPKDIPALSTPGISFFMSMPGPHNALQAFDFMLETAQCVVRNLGGELKDERRSVMTPQTVEHCRQRIREFERKQRSQRV
ncbi:cell division protein ZipA [Marinobacter salinisoli]|uniref:Cell division protein ZipA n=1 Tax=Marinobacter salinisoli TaxID=2769486 RepID=A0ABX7MP19_9GAMM|nr:cell division protein ZipA [Marinobacter salinisoli]QSP94042.1 cell division protein ZipA [Marinobacter salinisoli]